MIDCFGLLSSIYHYSDVAYVGGGFGVGIHNLLEAAVWGVPVIFGPNNKRFEEAQGLLAARGGFEITSQTDFLQLMEGFINDENSLKAAGERAEEFVEKLSGATDKVLSAIRLS